MSSDRIMQYFKNSICMKGPRYRALKFAISAKLVPQKKNLIVQIERATYDAPKKRMAPTRTTLINFTNYSVGPTNLRTMKTRHSRIIEFQMFE